MGAIIIQQQRNVTYNKTNSNRRVEYGQLSFLWSKDARIIHLNNNNCCCCCCCCWWCCWVFNKKRTHTNPKKQNQKTKEEGKKGKIKKKQVEPLPPLQSPPPPSPPPPRWPYLVYATTTVFNATTVLWDRLDWLDCWLGWRGLWEMRQSSEGRIWTRNSRPQQQQQQQQQQRLAPQ